MEKFFKTPTKTSTKKRKRSINPLFIDVSIIDVCHSYASPHNIIYNCQKTLGLSFASSNFKLNIKPNVVLGDFKIQFVNEIKYLGVFLNSKLCDDEDKNRHRFVIYMELQIN